MSYTTVEALPTMDFESRQWLERVAAAAQEAAGELRPLDDAHTLDLLDDLDRLCKRLNAELRAAGFDG